VLATVPRTRKPFALVALVAVVLAAVAGALVVILGGASSNTTPRIQVLHESPSVAGTGAAWTGGGIAEPQFEAPTSVWNSPVAAGAPLDPASSALSASVAVMAGNYPVALNVMKWSTPIYIVPAGQPTVYMHLAANRKTGRVNPVLQAAFAAVPVPPGARPATGTDNVLIIYQPSTDTMWETAKTRLLGDGWHFAYGGRIIHFSKNPGYYQQVQGSNGSLIEAPWWGNSASGLPVADSVITFRDLANGYIDHALGLLLPHNWIRGGVTVWPAARTDGRSATPDSVPEGARFRLDPNLDINSLHLPPLTRMIAYAAQRYGLIVRDGSSNISIDGQAPRTPAQTAAWKQALAGSGFRHWSQVLKSFPWSHLQLLRMTVEPVRSASG
jgi:hypothetical protein